MYGRSSNSLDPNNQISVFAQEHSKALSGINETSTSDMNRPLPNVFAAATDSSGANMNLQFQSINQANASVMNASKENPMLQVPGANETP